MKYLIFLFTVVLGVTFGAVLPSFAQQASMEVSSDFDVIPVQYNSPASDFTAAQNSGGGAGCGI